MGEKITCLSGTNINETRLFISADVYTGPIEQTQYPYQSTQHISPIEHMNSLFMPAYRSHDRQKRRVLLCVCFAHVFLAQDACTGCLSAQFGSNHFVVFSCSLFFVATGYWPVCPVAD